RIRQQRQQNVGADIAPDHGGEHRIGILAQVEDARGVGIAAVSLKLQAQLAEAEDGEVEPGKQRRLRYAGDNAEPSPESGDGGHGCFLKSLLFARRLADEERSPSPQSGNESVP